MKTKNRIITGITVVVILAIAGCKDKVDLPAQPLSDYIQVYMSQAVNGPVTYNFSTSDTTPATIIYGADYGGFGYPAQDVPISFDVDAAVADSFNLSYNTDYVLLPSKSYKMSDTSAVIKKGDISTDPFRVTITTNGENAPDDISKTYILPISIKTASLKVNKTLQTYFCIINIIPVFFDRTNWKIIDFSSQEAVGEGPDNGRAVFAIDGNINTYWHSQWKDAQPGPPHYITIDMGESKKMLGSALVDRQNVNSGRPQNVQIFVSNDDKDWAEAYPGTLLNTGDLQKVFFSKAISGRYVKFQVNTIYGSTLTNLAEFYLF